MVASLADGPIHPKQVSYWTAIHIVEWETYVELVICPICGHCVYVYVGVGRRKRKSRMSWG
jgi:hypothetical protein